MHVGQCALTDNLILIRVVLEDQALYHGYNELLD
jgi:hypothetical protein